MQDFQSDTSLQTLHRLCKMFLSGTIVDECTKQASEEVPANASGNVFGDPSMRRFACHNKSATWLNNIYYWGQLADGAPWTLSYPCAKVGARLLRAADYFGIRDDVELLRNMIASKSAAASTPITDDDYAMVVQYGDELIRRYPLVNAMSTKLAATRFVANRACYPYPWRKAAATKILERAMQWSVDLPADERDYLACAAGLFPRSRKEASRDLAQRAYTYPEECQLPMLKAAWVYYTSKDRDPVALCEVLDQIDNDMRKQAAYAAGTVAMPETLLFDTASATQKSAALQATEIKLGADTFLADDLCALGPEVLSVLGPEFVRKVADDLGVVNSSRLYDACLELPEADATTLGLAAKTSGATPRNRHDDILDIDKWAEFCAERGHKFSGKDFAISMRLQHEGAVATA